jgi:glycerol-3-phosphate dehydrogenase subunit B
MTNPEDKTYDVCIIGAGLAGLAATLFAANRDLTCVEVGQIGEINFASGLIDLLGVYPAEDNRSWNNPWEGIKALVQDNSQHPYARLPLDDIRTAFEEILTILKVNGLPYN